MKRFKLMPFLLVVLIVGFTSCKKDDDANPIPGEKDFVGSATCATCHTEIAATFANTGHPFKLNKVDGAAPTYPFSTVPATPTGYSWTDVTYVIGGYNWKARFVDSDGYIVTGDAVQYNLHTEGWVGYHADEAPGTKPYDCGKCHTTGWVHVDDGGINQDGLPGMHGQFSEPGIQCEACHDGGNIHAITQSASDITVDRSSEQCGSCHFRNEDHTIAAKGGFIKHHEQYDEMKTSAHFAATTCVTCHDSHKSVLHGSTDGIIKNCTECHGSITEGVSHNGADCVTCHLPLASKSAVNTDGNPYLGDVKTHIFKINTAADGNMFNTEGTLANTDKEGVTLDFICYRCHKDESNVGGSASKKTLLELSDYAKGYHTAKKVAVK